jgi:hypothetical protein
MDCLIDYIGVLGCGSSEPHSGLYVNSLPGISLKSIEALADAEQSNYLGVWDDVQLRASKKIGLDIVSQFSKRYKLDATQKTIDLGKNIVSTTIANSAQYRGILFDLDYSLDNVQWKQSALQVHYIQTLYFYSSGVVNGATVKFFDYDLNTEVDSITFNAVGGWNTIQVNSTYTERRLFIGVDCTNFTTSYLEIPSSASLCSFACGSYIQGGLVTIGDDISTLTESENTHGLSVVYSVKCKYDAIVCKNKESFALPLWYLLGSELMVERMNSERINKWTVDRKQAEELKAYYDTEYEKSLTQAIEGITIDESDECIWCDPLIAIRESNFW